MSSTELAAEIVDGVGVVSLNRPHRHNAVTDALFDALSATVRRYLDDPAVACVLLRGEGPSFCSGRDTAELGHRAGGEDDFTFVRSHQRLRLDMLEVHREIAGQEA